MSRSDRYRSDDERLESPSLSRCRNEMETHPSFRSGHAANGTNQHGQTDERHNRERGPEREPSQFLDEADVKTLTDLGTFRALDVEDIARHRYGGDRNETRKHLATLTRQGLIRSRTSYPERAVYVTLTRAGHRLAAGKGERENPNQRLYHGFVKTREARHDAALYRLYRQEIAHIEHKGGKVRRVVLDFELKQSINRQLVKLKGLPDREQIREKQQIAQDHGLTVVKGKIPLPDLRLEYEGLDQEKAKVDLELVTNHYHRRNLAAKAQAGFAMYAFGEDAARLRPAMQDPEIMQEILSL